MNHLLYFDLKIIELLTELSSTNVEKLKCVNKPLCYFCFVCSIFFIVSSRNDYYNVAFLLYYSFPIIKKQFKVTTLL